MKTKFFAAALVFSSVPFAAPTPLSCTRVGKEAEEPGLRDTCEVVNGL